MTDTMLLGDHDLEEHKLCRIGAYAWRYTGADIVYEQHTTIIGGPLLALTTGLLSAADNARRRSAAELQAVSHWRPLGWLNIIATSRASSYSPRRLVECLVLGRHPRLTRWRHDARSGLPP